MTTFTSDDRENAEKMVLDAFTRGKAFGFAEGMRAMKEQEPIPFMGWVDKEDTEEMLRHQLHVVQAECQRLQKILMNNGIPY
jgi:hypothetical protein